MDKFEVVREHFGDKHYFPGDLREIKKAEVSHLVPHVLIPATDDFVERWTAAQPKEPTKVWSEDDARQDGPTVEEYVEHGYWASNYPPKGYASKSTPEEIEAAVIAQSATKMAKEAEINSVDAGKQEQQFQNKMDPDPSNKSEPPEGDDDDGDDDVADKPGLSLTKPLRGRKR